MSRVSSTILVQWIDAIDSAVLLNESTNEEFILPAEAIPNTIRALQYFLDMVFGIGENHE